MTIALTLAGGKVQTTVRWLKELWSAWLTSSKQNLTATLNSSTLRHRFPGGELNPANVDSEMEAFAQQVSRGFIVEAHYLANLYGSNAPKVFALAHGWNKRQDSDLANTLSLLYNAQ